ncbi:hypothetical protein [Gordonibacter sp. 28C]|uniref:hypothetical protein n=1 Tax=Gordonibacter sp. 28C TaxID=2078569 RepID=UPI001314D281|nr:hypothetical protein [Gordonibacter sp. 28C]
MCFRPATVAPDKTCPACGEMCKPELDACPKCGAELPKASMPPMPGAPGAAGAPGMPKAPGAPGAPKPPSSPGMH